jgi:alkyl hydroperoxide reductase subunit AhpF
MYDLIVIGGGPAGLTAALYAIHKGLKILLITRDVGGKTNLRMELPWIENPSQVGPEVLRGLDMVSHIRSELDALQFDRLMDSVQKVRQTPGGFLVETQKSDGSRGQEIKARSLIVASGTRQMPLNIPGEKEYFLRGLGYSVLSYAPLLRGRVTAVVGEGELAVRSAAELATVAKQVYFICSHGEMMDLPLGRKLSDAKNTRILEGYTLLEVKGDGPSGDGFVRSLVIRDTEGKIESLEVDGVFIEKGLVSNSAMVADLVQTDPAGRILVDSMSCTSAAGIFAAGDVTNLYAENLLVAMGEGAKAALSAFDYLLPDL